MKRRDMYGARRCDATRLTLKEIGRRAKGRRVGLRQKVKTTAPGETSCQSHSPMRSPSYGRWVSVPLTWSLPKKIKSPPISLQNRSNYNIYIIALGEQVYKQNHKRNNIFIFYYFNSLDRHLMTLIYYYKCTLLRTVYFYRKMCTPDFTFR